MIPPVGQAKAFSRSAPERGRVSARQTRIRFSPRKRLLGDTQREASSSEVHDLRKENARLKELVAETVLENRLLKKSVTGSASLEDEA